MTSQTIRISLPGAGGRMGGMLVSEIAKADGLSLVVATDRAGSPHIGLDAGVLAGVGPTDVLVGSDPASLFSDSDVVIDFSAPEASLQHAVLAAETGTAIVIGTTGLSAEHELVLRQAATQTAIVYCANTSVGVTLLTQLVEQVAAQLKSGWDIEILEAHHHHKLDAPSGTALALAKQRRVAVRWILIRFPISCATARPAPETKVTLALRYCAAVMWLANIR